MSRPVTLFTGQWADLPLEQLAARTQAWGYDGLELACWGDHLDVSAALAAPDYCQGRYDLLERYGQRVWAISNHLVGQLVCDANDSRSDEWAPKALRGQPEAMREWAIEEMVRTAQVARKLGVKVVNGFTGSSIWHLLYRFPNYDDGVIDEGFRFFAQKWLPILDEFQKNKVRFALEVHPTEIAYDIVTARRALEAVHHHPAFGFNFDPSHLLWQGIDPVRFIDEFSDRIFHVHMKDAGVYLDGETSILASHLQFGHHRRGWDFRSLGHGQVNFEAIIRALNRIGYQGPLSVEWEDSGMDREFGAREALEFVRKIDFTPSPTAFDAAFGKG